MEILKYDSQNYQISSQQIPQIYRKLPKVAKFYDTIKNTDNLWATFWFNLLRSILQTFQIISPKNVTFRMTFLIKVHCA